MIILDTTILIGAFTGAKTSAPALRRAIEEGERFLLPSMVLYEWLRGPRTQTELAVQDTLFPSAEAVPFSPAEAAQAALIYKSLARPRGREIDIAIAAYALVRGARLWTLNRDDFSDIPNLRL